MSDGPRRETPSKTRPNESITRQPIKRSDHQASKTFSRSFHKHSAHRRDPYSQPSQEKQKKDLAQAQISLSEFIVPDVDEKPVEAPQEPKKSDDKTSTFSGSSFFDAGKLMTEVRASLTELELTKCPKIRGPFITSIKRTFGKVGYMRKADFECRDKQLFNCCLKGVKDKHQLHKNREMGIRILEEIILRASPTYITPHHVVNLTWCIMSCMHHFQLRLRTDSTGIVRTVRSRAITRCMQTYSKLIRMFNPDLQQVVLSAILTFYKCGKMWEFEFACTDLVLDLLAVYPHIDEAVAYIFDTALDASKHNYTEGKFMFQILYDVIRKLKWHNISNGLMNKFLDAFESSITRKSTDYFDYAPLRRCLELSIRNSVDNLSNPNLMATIELCIARVNNNPLLDDDILMELGALAGYAASLYKVKTFLSSISPTFLSLLGDMSRKRLPLGLIMSIRLWKNLIDRNKNENIFKTPRIFFQDCDYQIVLRKCKRTDKQFYKSYRQLLYKMTIDGFTLAQTKCHLDLLYQLVALTSTEIPCGYTASTSVAIIMHLQHYAFNLSSTDLLKSHYLHAIVLSIMSLICYIHKATILYTYVNDIMDRRAEWAPHLNPPLLHNYDYAVHHILWNKPNLFFLDWETGYGLWKCFREKKKKRRNENTTKKLS